MKRNRLLLSLSLPALALLLLACGGGSDPIDVGQAPTTQPEPGDGVPITTPGTGDDDPADGEGSGDRVEVTIYFTEGDRLVPATRIVTTDADLDAAAAEAIRALLDGPTRAEREAGLGTEIPEGTRFLSLTIGDDRIATVDLSGEFETGGGTASMRARLGQVACTLDNVVALDIADGTRFMLDGKPVSVFSGEGIVIDDFVTCADYHDLATEGEAATGCVNGWTTPPVGDPRRQEGIDLLRISAGVDGRFVVEDLRYFSGPDHPGAVEPGHALVDRWYVKARLESDPSFRGRFLIEKRGSSGGVVAVAGYGTEGWQPGDWSGFEGEGEAVTHPGLPGTWGGVRYDFVTGEGGPGHPGLPAELTGCVADT